VRAFDFHYEMGHGTRRATRHYSVVVAELGGGLPDALLWHVADDAPPPGVADARDSIGRWVWRGDEALAADLGRACRGLAGRPVSVQAHGGRLMFALPVRKARRDYALRLSDAGDALAAIAPSTAVANVENRPHS
jgi:hypothetical protein